MAIYSYNYKDGTGYTHGQSVPGVSFPYATPATSYIDTTTFGYPVVREAHSGNQENTMIYNEIPSSTTQEVLIRTLMTYGDASGTDYQSSISLRGSGNVSSRNTYTINFLKLSNIVSEGYLGNASFVYGSATSFGYSTNTWYWLRARIEGNVTSYKVWQDGNAEPAGWTAQISDTRITGAGWMGIGAWSGNGTRYFSHVAMTTNGETALVTYPQNRTQTGIARIQQVNLRNQTGIAKIQYIQSRAQTGKTRIFGKATWDQLGKARITIATPRTQTGIARLTIGTNRTQTGISRITAQPKRLQIGKANITGVTQRTQLGKGAIRITQIRIITGTSKLNIQTLRTQTGRANLGSTTLRPQTGVSRIITGLDTRTKPNLKMTVDESKPLAVVPEKPRLGRIIGNI